MQALIKAGHSRVWKVNSSSSWHVIPAALLNYEANTYNQSINMQKPAMPKGHSRPSSTRPLMRERERTTQRRGEIPFCIC